MKHKVGDYVLVKPGTQLESGEQVDNWGGKIIETYPSDNTCLLQFDSITLEDISAQYIIDCHNEGAEPFEYVFLAKELVPAKRRDNEEALAMAIEDMYERMEVLDPDAQEEYDEELEHEWIEAFLKSKLYRQLTEREQENAAFTISTFMGYMWDYHLEAPPNWTPYALEDVCFSIVPRKVSTDEGFFEDYGKVLISFLHFLEKKEHISNATSLIETVEAIQEDIPKEAANPENWGMAKSMMMGGMEAGYNMDSQEDLDAYMQQVQMQQLRLLGDGRSNSSAPKSKLKYAKPLEENPYKNIGRNDKINVKYTDGKVVMAVKFKKVQKDLLGGRCEIIKG